jgi:hypothetical protein
MINDDYDDTDDLGLSVSVQEEEIVLDEKVMDQFFYHIEEASNEVLKSFNMQDYRLELLVTLLSCAAMVSMEIELDEEDLVYLLSQSYVRVLEQIQQIKEYEIEHDLNIN